MMHDFYMLEAGRWTGLTEMPVRPGWPAGSPVLIERVTPLKTGQGRLQVDMLQPLYPGGGRRRTVTARVVQKAPAHLTCLFEEGDQRCTAVFAQPDFAWLASCAPDLLARRPLAAPAFILNGEPAGVPTWEDHLEATFGSSAEEVLRGTSAKSFAVKPGPMPRQHARLSLSDEFAPFDSALIARGFTSNEMEDRWFIIPQKGHLLFRRSWTGILIYDVEAAWRGDRLHLGQALVNREPDQYGETDDAYDLALLRYLIDVILRGVSAKFPTRRQNAS